MLFFSYMRVFLKRKCLFLNLYCVRNVSNLINLITVLKKGIPNIFIVSSDKCFYFDSRYSYLSLAAWQRIIYKQFCSTYVVYKISFAIYIYIYKFKTFNISTTCASKSLFNHSSERKLF